MRDGCDGVVCVVFVNAVCNGGCDVIGIHFVTSDGGQETVRVVVEFGEDFVDGGAGLVDFCRIAEKIIGYLIYAGLR